MAKAVFTTSESSGYDDLPEIRYHFPKTYLNQVRRAVGDFIVDYEPRRTEGPGSSTGRQAYFAVGRVASVSPDSNKADHYYAHIMDYLALDTPVPFREGDFYFESMLRRPDGMTSKGAFGRSVREIPEDEFEAIIRAGFARAPAAWEEPELVADLPARPLVTQLVTRPFRERSFKWHVREAYGETCAISGLRLINGGGRPEVQAAHIRPVAANGPDSIRNGIALTGTIHWLFDRGLITVDDGYRIVISPRCPADQISPLVRPNAQLRVPRRPEHRPHPAFLKWHRENHFKT